MATDSMLTVEEAQRIVLDSTSTLDTERVLLTQVLDRILAEDIAPRYDIPPHDNSSVDGYAVQAEDARIGIVIATPPCGNRVLRSCLEQSRDPEAPSVGGEGVDFDGADRRTEVEEAHRWLAKARQ